MKISIEEQYKLINSGKKHCPKCNEIKPLPEFNLCKHNKMGYLPRCKACVKIDNKERRPLSEFGKTWKQSLYDEGKKHCPKCNEVKPLSEFGNLKKSYSGKMSFCKSCKSTRDKEYRNELKEKGLYTKKKRNEYLKNIDKYKERETKRIRDYKKEYQDMKNDKIRYFKYKIRNLLLVTLKNEKLNKSSEEIFNCTWEELKTHLPNEDDNIHVHHIIPIAHGKTIDELIRLSNYKNLKQIPDKLNLSIGNKIIIEWLNDELKSLFNDIINKHADFIISIFDHYQEIKMTNNVELIQQCESEIKKLNQ
jgi:hypothetical protein